MDKTAFFLATELPVEQVSIEGYGIIDVRPLTLSQRIALPEKYSKDRGEAIIWLVINGVDGLGEEDEEHVRRMRPPILERIASKVMEMTEVAEGDTEAEKNV